MKYFVQFLLFFGLFAGCTADETGLYKPDAEWFPLLTGNFYIFEVQETLHAAGTPPQSSVYDLRVQVVDSFPSANGVYRYVFHRSVRQEGSETWDFLDTWSATTDAQGVIVSEGNLPFVKVRFPVRPDNRWNGNLFNTLGEDEYTYRDINATLELNGISFDRTVTVEQEYNDDPIVFTDKRREVFARGVGLVMKEIIQLYYCTADACLGQQKIEYGTEMKMVIKDYGIH